MKSIKIHCDRCERGIDMMATLLKRENTEIESLDVWGVSVFFKKGRNPSTLQYTGHFEILCIECHTKEDKGLRVKHLKGELQESKKWHKHYTDKMQEEFEGIFKHRDKIIDIEAELATLDPDFKA